MEAFRFIIKEIEFSCCCGWQGKESDLDYMHSFSESMVCCPDCKNTDVRVLNKINEV
jgi:hypothetical protein